TREPPYFRYGDLLDLRGEISEPPVLEYFDWREHLAREGIHSLITRPRVTFLAADKGGAALGFIYNLRTDLARGVAHALPEPQASLSHAMLLGVRSTLPSELREDLASTGTTHLIAISGLHVGIIVGVVSGISLSVFGRRRHLYILIPLLFIWGYALLTGMGPPVLRASIMGSLYLWALYLGRQRSAFVPLAGAAAVMVAIDPDALYDVSFQLSFLAMAGLILLAPWLQVAGRLAFARTGMPEGWPRSLALLALDATAISLAAILATMPVVAFNFHQVPLVGLPATLAVLPALPLILVTSLLVALVGLFAPVLAQALGWIAWPWLTYMVGVVELFSWVPALSADLGSAAVPLAWAYYFAAALGLWLLHKKWGSLLWRSGGYLPSAAQPELAYSVPKRLLSWRRWAVVAGVVPLLLFVSIAMGQPSDRLRVTFLDVGQGDSILVQTPSQKTVLIDGGPAFGLLALELGQWLPFWDRTLDLVVLTHPDGDHVNGLIELLGRYDVEQVIHCGIDCTTDGNDFNYLTWRSALSREGVEPLDAEAGQV
ncbi:MAG: ComEC/Rec2 family competence protein, partial [Dehalococcoidia bacterium]